MTNDLDNKPVGPNTKIDPRLAIGANNPPEALDFEAPEQPSPFNEAALQATWADVNLFAATAGDWMDLKEIDNNAHASLINDFIAGARKKKKIVDDERKAAKKPFDDAGKAVQAAYSIPIMVLARCEDHSKKLLDDWLTKENQRIEEERLAAQEVARLAALAAQKKLDDARARNDVAGEIAAEEAAKVAAKEQKTAERPDKARVSSATGGTKAVSQRTSKFAIIKNINVLFMHYCNHPKMIQLLQELANADLRSTSIDDASIPGIEIEERKSL